MLSDLRIVVERHSEVFATSSKSLVQFFRGIAAFALIGFLFAAVTTSFSLTSGQLFTFELWRVVTHAFASKNVLLFAWTFFTCFKLHSYIDPETSSVELVKVFVVAQLGSAGLICLAAFAALFFGNESFYYRTPIEGLAPLNVAVLVLVKQFLPDSIVLTTPFGRVKRTNLPLLSVLVVIILYFFKCFHLSVVLQTIFGLQLSWTYLRFFRPHPSDDVKGDSSEHFAWATLFPRVFQPACVIVGRIIFRSLVKARLCHRQVRHVDLNQMQAVPVVIPIMETKDAERRRQKALRDLAERLNRAKKVETVKWAEDDDDSEDTRTAVESTSVHAVPEVSQESAERDEKPKEDLVAL